MLNLLTVVFTLFFVGAIYLGMVVGEKLAPSPESGFCKVDAALRAAGFGLIACALAAIYTNYTLSGFCLVIVSVFVFNVRSSHRQMAIA